MWTAILSIISLVLKLITEQVPSVAVRNAKKAAKAANLEKAVEQYDKMAKVVRRGWGAVVADRLRDNTDNK